ncbi:MAG TPA: 50S ribosomal protein L25 [Thiobacillus sp.]|nr:50S ribosomal protein L25 [Thiobacillus sp.]
MQFVAFERAKQGTGASRRLRHAGKVPGIVYGGTAVPVQIELDHNALYHALRKESFHASVLTLNVDGAKESVLLRDTQWHPYKQQVLHVDFQRVDKTHKIHVKIPLHFLNEDTAPGVKTGGGKVSHVVTELDVTCLPGNLPEFIVVDMGALELGHSIHANDLTLPDGVELVAHIQHENPAVATVTLPKGMKSDEPASESPAAPAA